MKSNMLASLLACAALAVAAPVVAKPGGGKGHGAAPGFSNGNDTLAPSPARRRGHGPDYGVNACPPGLAAKHNGCLPPGQAKRTFERGQRIPRGFGFYTPLRDIPLVYRDQIPRRYRGGDYDYIYRDNDIYVVDPTTLLVADIIRLVL